MHPAGERWMSGSYWNDKIVRSKKLGLIFNALRIIRKIVQKLFSRLFVVALGIVLQIAWLFLVLYQFSAQHTFANVIVTVLGILTAFYVISRPFNPAAKLAWTVMLLTVPLLGILIYFVFGRPELTKRTKEGMEAVNLGIEAHLQQDVQVQKHIKETDANILRQSAYILRQAKFPVYEHTETKYYPCGEEMFEDMLNAISQAEHFIFLEYFIISPGVMFDRLLNALEQKVRQGVDVRLIYDDIGCVATLPVDFVRYMETIGIRCAVFNRFRPILSIVMNNRDHRKILVVDGIWGFTGGINIADEYINEKVRFGYWKDTGIRLKGEAVRNFTAMFLEMWDYIRGEKDDCLEYFLSFPEYQTQEHGFVQPYGDTPLDRENVGENVYLNMISKAKHYLYIYTPYLIIDQEMQTALCNAAKSGVDVRIVTPGIPDKKMIFLMTRSNYQVLLESGIKIYEYTPGFIHAKCFLCDDETAAVGSINLDYRSLYLHFECGVWMYRSEAVMQLKEDMEQTFACSHQILKEEWKEPNFFLWVVQTVLKLFAPLL